jgi:hypothetical protein
MLPGIIFKKIQITPMRIFLSTSGIFYVWSLPLLSYYGFAQPNATSSSGFIANPPATGAMAAVSFMPLTLMWEYQDNVLSTLGKKTTKRLLYGSLVTFEFFYGCFLVCTETYAPLWLHRSVVTLFGASFAFHGILIMCALSTSMYANAVLVTGMLSFVSLMGAPGLWFWACECIAFSSMLLFTPILWYTYTPAEDQTDLYGI